MVGNLYDLQNFTNWAKEALPLLGSWGSSSITTNSCGFTLPAVHVGGSLVHRLWSTGSKSEICSWTLTTASHEPHYLLQYAIGIIVVPHLVGTLENDHFCGVSVSSEADLNLCQVELGSEDHHESLWVACAQGLWLAGTCEVLNVVLKYILFPWW